MPPADAASTIRPASEAFCLDCGYRLRGLSRPICPECGRRFDRSNPASFATSPRRALARFVRSLPFFFPLVLLAVWWLHVGLTLAGDPLGEGFDLVLYLAASALKLATFASLPVVLGRVYAVIADRRDVAVKTFFLWAACSLIVVGGWALLRERAAPILRGGAVSYLVMSEVPEWEQGRLNWHARWPRGEIVVAEMGLALVLCAMHAHIGLRVGRDAGPAVAIGFFATAVLVFAHVFVFRLVDLDFDFFHGDIFSAALLMDLAIFFVAGDPYTTIASTVYAAIALSSLWVVRRYGR